MEQVKYVSAMEQELARSITQIATIKSAGVHLATTKKARSSNELAKRRSL